MQNKALPKRAAGRPRVIWSAAVTVSGCAGSWEGGLRISSRSVEDVDGSGAISIAREQAQRACVWADAVAVVSSDMNVVATGRARSCVSYPMLQTIIIM